MARTNKSRINKVSSHKANALGFSKRRSRVPKASAELSDVYEFQHEKVRRSKVTLSLGRDEIAELGRQDHSDDEEDGVDPLKGARLIGENKDDEMIDSEDDEDIDSDAAFGDSDEETFAGYGFSRKTKSKPGKSNAQISVRDVRFPTVDLNEDDSDAAIDLSQEKNDSQAEEEEEEEGDSNEFVDVLDIVDGRAEPDDGSDNESSGLSHRESTRKDQDVERDDMDEDDDDSAEQPLDQGISSDDEVENPTALEDLDAFISNLEVTAKRKIADEEEPLEPPDNSRIKKRKLFKERTEAGVESEFAAGKSSDQTKLNLEDLLTPLESQSSSLLALKKSTKLLASSKGKALSAPLPQRAQERLDREAAYEQTKKEVDKWHATMKRIKEAEHLSFPLQSQSTPKPSNLELVAKFRPTTSLETSVDKLLKQANMLDSDIQKSESLRMNHLSLEEVAARHAELQKMRNLMFHAEVKAKRLSKIKSKTYRRLKKKEKQKLMEKLGDEDDADDDATRLKREVERARERATLKHKNTGKWAKAMKARGELDEDQRRDVLEMFERGVALKKKIRGDNGSGEDEDEHSDDENDLDPDVIRADAFKEVSQLRSEDKLEPVESKKGNSIFEMKFMKNAIARDNQRAREMEDEFLDELDALEDEDRDKPLTGDGESSGVAIQRTGVGRVTYRPGALPQLTLRPMGSLASDASSVTLRSTDFTPDSPIQNTLSFSPKQPTREVVPSPSSARADANPWLTLQGSSSTRAPRKNNEVLVAKTSGAADKSKNRLRKRQENNEGEKDKAKEDAVVDISMTEVMNLDNTSNTRLPNSAQPSKKESRADDDDGSDRNSELEDQEDNLARKKKAKTKSRRVKAFEQRDLVALAFAGDKVVQDFQEAKQREINEDAPHEVDTTLPGWGSWGGIGARKAPPRPHLIKKVAGVDPTTRADYNKPNVIISEKRDKKASKYMVKDLPYPYTSKAQFERSMEIPVGTEWNTRVGFQRRTLPRVLKKPGVVIEPLEKVV